jgi:hypothetical protein
MPVGVKYGPAGSGRDKSLPYEQPRQQLLGFVLVSLIFGARHVIGVID